MSTETGITKTESIKDFMGKPNVQTFIQDILGKKSTAFATNLTQVVSQNALLKDADKPSILNAAITATLLDLNLNPSFGHAYLVPFKTRQHNGSYKTLAQFILGYKGLKQLAIRSGQFRSIDTKEVYEGQYIEDDSFIGFKFKWSEKKSDEVIGYACRFELLNGFEKILFMTKKQIEDHGRKYSKTFSHKNGQWQTNFGGMAKKTVTKLCLNSGEAPLSIEMQRAINSDMAVVNDVEDQEFEYVDNPEETDVIVVSEKPSISPEEFEQVKNGVVFQTMTIDQAKKNYELSESQITELESIKPKK